MKTVFTIIFLVISIAPLHAQYKAILRKIPVSKKIYLHSKTHIGTDDNKVLIPVNLPPRTKCWYYSIVANRDQKEDGKVQAGFDLLGDLSKAIDRSGITKDVLKLISSPTGSDIVDAYLLPTQAEAIKFQASGKGQNETINYILENSALQVTSAVIEVNQQAYNTGTQYLGILNQNAIYGINVNVQIVAIVEEPVTQNGWTTEFKNNLFKEMTQILRANDTYHQFTNHQVDDLVGCILVQLTHQYSLDQYQALAEYEKARAFKVIANDCKKEVLSE